MRNKKLWKALFCGGLTSAVILTGCSATSSNSVVVSDSTLSGTVSSVDGDTITISANTGMGGGMGGGQAQDGNAPSGEAPSGEAPSGNGGDQGSVDGQTPPEKPDGDSTSTDDTKSTTDDSKSTTDDTKTDTDSSTDSADQSSSDSADAKEKPSGNSGEQPSGDQPSGDAGGQQPSGDQGGDSSGLTFEIVLKDTSVLKDSDDNTVKLSDIKEGDNLTVKVDENGNITSVVVGESSGSSEGVTDYTALKEFTEDSEVSGESYDSTGTDENAILVSSGAKVTFDNIEATRTSKDSTGGDNSSFYGVGAALLTTDGTSYVKGGNFTTDANGGAGLFAYGDGVVYASDSTIKTSADTSGGIHVAGGGTLYAWDLDVTTAGESSAAIRSDRGGGTMVVDGGTYTSTGTGSPAVYTTADISVSDATLTAENSEGICLEGKNNLRLYNCDLTGNMADDDQNDCTWNVILYQSMSGDSEEGEGTFQMTGGSLTAKNGGQFYTTNTQSTFYLSDVDITNASDSEFFLRCTGNNNQRGWGSSGSNGADCNFTTSSQTMEGDVIYDSISNLDFYLTNGSVITGAFVDDETYAGDGGDGSANLYIDSDSTWIVTGDSTLTSLQSEGTIQDTDGKTVTIKGTDGTVYVEGDSQYTITVEKYSKTADLSGATTGDSFSDHSVDKPDELS